MEKEISLELLKLDGIAETGWKKSKYKFAIFPVQVTLVELDHLTSHGLSFCDLICEQLAFFNGKGNF